MLAYQQGCKQYHAFAFSYTLHEYQLQLLKISKSLQNIRKAQSKKRNPLHHLQHLRTPIFFST